MTAYDEVPYLSLPHPESHPDRLRLIADLFGLAPAPVERCRVLEVGCSAGGNLIPMAEAFPESRFLGVDLAERAVADGQKAIAELGLENVELRAADITTLDVEGAAWDYIIAHGVYSWVPDPVKAALLDLVARGLAADGVAYISHNVKPGWFVRAAAREVMRFQGGAGTDSRARAERGRALLGFVAHAAIEPAWSEILRREHAIAVRQPEWLLYHDALAEMNDACWFHELAAALGARRLKFLADAHLGSMIPTRYPPDVQETLERLAPDVVRNQQYLDFLDNRAFRRTLVVGGDRNIVRQLGAPQARKLHFTSLATEAAPGKWKTQGGGEVTVGNERTRVALRALALQAPASLDWSALLAAAGITDAFGDELAGDLLKLSLESFLDMSLAPARCVASAGPLPRTPGHARLAARRGQDVTSLRHEPVNLGSEARSVIIHLDGTNGRDALRQLSGLTDADTLEHALASLASHALLVR